MVTKGDIDRRFAAARAAWPGIDVAREDFAAWFSQRAGNAAEGINSDELYLACACAHNAPGAIRTLEAHYFGSVAKAVARFGPAALADDIKQEVLQRLFVGTPDTLPKIGTFTGKGSLSAWLRAIAVRIALNLARTKKNQPHTTLGDDDFISIDDPELTYIKSAYREAFKEAFADATRALPAELQNFLRFYYLDGLDLAQIGTIYKLSVPTVSRRLARARAEVLEATRARLKERLRVDSAELDSIMQLIQSRPSLHGLGDESVPG